MNHYRPPISNTKNFSNPEIRKNGEQYDQIIITIRYSSNKEIKTINREYQKSHDIDLITKVQEFISKIGFDNHICESIGIENDSDFRFTATIDRIKALSYSLVKKNIEI